MAIDVEFAEKETTTPLVKVVFQRHGETDRTRPKQEDPLSAQNSAGGLTDKGYQHNKEVAENEVKKLLAQAKGKKVTFFFLHSGTPWYSEDKTFRKRAAETAQLNAYVTQEIIDQLGLTRDQAEVKYFSTSQGGSTPDTKLEEPDLYYVWESKDPTAYHRALREKYGTDWEEGFHKMEPELEQVRKETGATSSEDLGKQTMTILNDIQQKAAEYTAEHPDEIQVYWSTTHGDKQRSTLQYGLGVGDDALGYKFKESELFEVDIKDGKATTRFKDKAYQIDLSA